MRGSTKVPTIKINKANSVDFVGLNILSMERLYHNFLNDGKGWTYQVRQVC
jgi:hypothetical protein